MRLPPALSAGRIPQNELTVPFKLSLPLHLRDHVSGKGDKGSPVACLQEMSVLFACFKANEFNQVLCGKEIGSFQSCYQNFMKNRLEKIEAEKRGVSSSVGAKRLNHLQINEILAKFPNK